MFGFWPMLTRPEDFSFLRFCNETFWTQDFIKKRLYLKICKFIYVAYCINTNDTTSNFHISFFDIVKIHRVQIGNCISYAEKCILSILPACRRLHCERVKLALSIERNSRDISKDSSLGRLVSSQARNRIGESLRESLRKLRNGGLQEQELRSRPNG